MLEMVNVSKETFCEFLRMYPRKLVRDVCAIVDPPAVSYNDFTIAEKWPYSIVAQTSLYPTDPNDYYYTPEYEHEYSIAKKYADEIFKGVKYEK